MFKLLKVNILIFFICLIYKKVGSILFIFERFSVFFFKLKNFNPECTLFSLVSSQVIKIMLVLCTCTVQCY